MSYNEFYSKGGFKYSKNIWKPRIENLVNQLGIEGKLLDAPSGDGFWGRLLLQAMTKRQQTLRTNIQCFVQSTDLSTIACDKSNGTLWDLNVFNPQWENAFDWVFCRGISHLHCKIIDITPFLHLSKYAHNMLIIYSTTQTNNNSKNKHHFNHTRKALDDVMKVFMKEGTKYYSYMEKSYYHYVRLQN